MARMNEDTGMSARWTDGWMDRQVFGAIAVSPTREEGLAAWDPWLA